MKETKGTSRTLWALCAALAFVGTSGLALAAPKSGQSSQRGSFTGVIESVDPGDGPWLTLAGSKSRRTFLCGDFAEDCMRWQCRDLGRKLTVHYLRSTESLEGGELVEVERITRIDGPIGPADKELNRVRCLAHGLRMGAETGSEGAAAANSLGVWYERGKHGLKQNLTEARNWYQEAAKHGNALAMHNLGDLYRQGKGVRQDSSEAFDWYKKAADAGHAIGLEDMADCYLKGVGVEADRNEAIRLYREAARQGRTSAAQKLREMGL